MAISFNAKDIDNIKITDILISIHFDLSLPLDQHQHTNTQ